MADSTAYDSSLYCNFDDVQAKAIPGNRWCLCVFDANGNLLAVGGQQSLSISRASDSIDVSSKDTSGGWKASIAGLKEWSIDIDGVYVPSDDAHQALSDAFINGNLVCLKIMDRQTKEPIMGGLAAITDYSIDASYDDKVGYSLSFQGNGGLTDLTDLSSTDALKVVAVPKNWK